MEITLFTSACTRFQLFLAGRNFEVPIWPCPIPRMVRHLICILIDNSHH